MSQYPNASSPDTLASAVVTGIINGNLACILHPVKQQVSLNDDGMGVVQPLRRRLLNLLFPGKYGCELDNAIFDLVLFIAFLGLLLIMPSDEDHWTLLMTNKHWFK